MFKPLSKPVSTILKSYKLRTYSIRNAGLPSFIPPFSSLSRSDSYNNSGRPNTKKENQCLQNA